MGADIAGAAGGGGMTHRWLVLRLEAPLVAYGGVSIDHYGPTRAFPALSAITGLLGNALGWAWADRDAHAALQARIVMGARADRAGRQITDIQNAKLEKSDKGWTTWGAPEGRDGDSYRAPHRRQREYLADASHRVVLRLVGQGAPVLGDLAEALQRPARPLFIGRKPCLPTRPIFAGWTEGDTAHAALLRLGATDTPGQWPEGDGPEGDRLIDLPDTRDWVAGFHTGRRRVVQGMLAR